MKGHVLAITRAAPDMLAATMRAWAALLLAASVAPAYRTHNDRLTVPAYGSGAEWARRAAYLREHVLVSHGLMPMPDKTPLRAVVFAERRHDDYAVAKVYFESL